jgi:hypothetical protein
MDVERDDRSLGQLFGDLSRQLGTLVQRELELARTEMTTRVTTVSRDAVMLGAGAALAYAAALVGLVAIALVLVELGLDAWVAFLVVAVVTGVAAAVLVQRGLERLRQANLAPKQTIETIKDDAAWAKERVK